MRKTNIKNGTRISLMNAAGVGYSAEIISQTEGCETKVTMYGASIFWKSIFKMIDSAAKGEEAKWSLF